MSYIQIINKIWLNERTEWNNSCIQRVLKMRRVASTMDAGYCRSYSTLMPPLMVEMPGLSVYKYLKSKLPRSATSMCKFWILLYVLDLDTDDSESDSESGFEDELLLIFSRLSDSDFGFSFSKSLQSWM